MNDDIGWQCEDGTVRCEEKNKGTAKCDKRIVTRDIKTAQCENGTVKCRSEQNVAGANLTDQRQQLCPDTSADRLSRGWRSEGEACSDDGVMRSPDQRILHRSTPN